MTNEDLDKLIDLLLAQVQSGSIAADGPAITDAASIAASTPRPAPEAHKVSTRAATVNRGDEVSGGVGSVLARTFLGGLGLAGLFKGLFGGDDSERKTAPLPRFNLAPSVRSEAAFDSETRQLAAAEYGADGVVRSAAAPTSVTVNVNAMDSRSFLEHRDDIALAVREALLHSHPLADVIGEL